MFLSLLSTPAARPTNCFCRTAIIVISTVILLAAKPAYSQQQEALISTDFTAISLDGAINGLKYDSGSTSKALSIPSASRSVQYSYSGPAELVFYVPDKAPEGEPFKRPVASVNLSGFAGKTPLLIFTKANNELSQYAVAAIDDNWNNFPGNTWRVFNLTPSALALKVGTGAPRAIAPSGMQTFSFGSDPRGPQRIQIAMAVGQDWKLAVNSIWSHNPQIRSLIFIFPSDNGNSVRIQQFDQSLNGMN